MPKILDACCGSRMFWFDKNNPDVVFADNRKLDTTLCDGRTLVIEPDMIIDFRDMPFNDNTFKGVVRMDNIVSDNDKKKEYLRSYQTHVRRIHRINAEIAELRSMKMNPSLKPDDGMPHGNGGQGDLSGYAAELDEMIQELIKERYLRIKTYQQIVRQIKRMKSENEKDVLFYRYIRCLDWWEIAEKMKYSERQIHRFHGKALAHFELPKDVIECQ